MAIHTPNEVAGLFNKSALTKASMSTSKIFTYSILGGAYIAIGGLLAIVIAGGSPHLSAENPGLTKFLFGAVFPIGLIMVVIGGAELFTSDCAVMPVAALDRQIRWRRVAKLWAKVYVGNFIGAVLVAFLLAYATGILEKEPWIGFTQAIAQKKMSASFIKVFVKGIGANWLVCMAVWMAYAAKDTIGKTLMIWAPVMAFVTLGFEHSIANMFFIPTAMLYGMEISWLDFIIKSLVPATLGNIVGGVVFVALAYWYLFLNKKVVKTTAEEHSTAKEISITQNFDIRSKAKNYD